MGEKAELPKVYVWARVTFLRTKEAVRCNHNEKTFFDGDQFNMKLLTNNTIRVAPKGRPLEKVHIPLTNVLYYHTDTDGAYEPEGTAAAG